MRIILNLSAADSSRNRYALVWGIPATLVGLLGLVLLVVSGNRQIREYHGVQSQVAEVRQREDELRKKEAGIRKDLEKPEYRAMLGEARFVNSLIDQKQLSLTGLAARIADLLPDEARLTGLALTSREGEMVVRMSISGKSEEAVETFLSDLEDAPDFKDVTIINQGFQEEGVQSGQVNIACTAHYLPGAAVAEPEVKSQEPEGAEKGKPKLPARTR